MTGYYNDDDKITFDRASELVEQYLKQNGELRTRITCKDVAEKFDVEQSHHNLIRINDALDERLDVVREAGAKATQYKVE